MLTCLCPIAVVHIKVHNHHLQGRLFVTCVLTVLQGRPLHQMYQIDCDTAGVLHKSPYLRGNYLPASIAVVYCHITGSCHESAAEAGPALPAGQHPQHKGLRRHSLEGHLSKAISLLGIARSNGHIVEEAEAHGRLLCRVVPRRPDDCKALGM